MGQLAKITSCVALALIASACGDSPTLVSEQHLSTESPSNDKTKTPPGDTIWVDCPKFGTTGTFGHGQCRFATREELDIIGHQISGLFAPTQACQDAGVPLMETVTNSDGSTSTEVYVSESSTGESSAYTASDPAAPPPGHTYWLVLSSQLLTNDYVQYGILRHVLYHEGSHAMGYRDDATEETVSAEEFADTCREAETVAVSSEQTTGGTRDESKTGETCYYVHYWYTDTGEDIRTDFLGCF